MREVRAGRWLRLVCTRAPASLQPDSLVLDDRPAVAAFAGMASHRSSLSL